ncbi:MAG TPA: hypothetical protein C5S37_10545, partial [Methanophagales archaeon]|nr:hypothetical protein [Methanophagales archaeon]
ESIVTMTGTENWSNVTMTRTATLRAGDWRRYRNDTSGNLNDTRIQILTIDDTTPPVPSNIEANTTEAGGPVLFSAYWTDNVGLANYTFAWNDTGVWINESIVTMTGTENWSNVTMTLNTTLKSIGWRIYCNDTSGNLNDTGIQILTINDITPPVPSNIGVNTTGAGMPVLFYTYWTDNVGLANYTFAWNDSGVWENVSFDEMTGTENWSNVTMTLNTTLKTIGWRIYCNDTSGNLNDTGIQILTINDTTPPVPSNIGANTTEAGMPFLLYAYRTDILGLANQRSAENDSGVWENVSFDEMTGTENWSNVTMTLNTTLKTIGWRIYCNDTSGNLNDTGIQILTINDTTPPVPSNIGANTTEAGMPVVFYTYWTDNVGLANYTFAWNDSGVWVNYSTVEMTGTENWSNVTMTLNTTLKTIGWRIYCNDTSGNRNDTGIQILTIDDTTPPVPSNIGVNTTEAGMPVLFYAYWTDNVGLANYTFSCNDT